MTHTNTTQAAADAFNTNGLNTRTDAELHIHEAQANAIATDFTLITTTAEARVDSRELAQHLHNKHQSLYELIKNHRADFEELGILRFQTGVIDGRGQPEKFTMLNEDQCTLALSYSKNTPRVRQLKVKLVKAFGEARRAAYLRKVEYLPSYHRLSDAIHTAAAGSSNEKHVHGNIARLLNKTVGLETGQRAFASTTQQAYMIMAQDMATKAMQSAADHHDGFQRVKQSMQALLACITMQVGHG